ncbi:MAG: NADH-quinone oxidoreductase subunit J, partial [Desulfobulbaceae bacterium]|nr:NADH-quinone oxidoreductase subunit J [Desulfobulbaceae bacterium]
TAALYILLQLEFVALAQIMLYIGGIVIFMLIIILLTTGLGSENRHKVPTSRRLVGTGVSGFLLFGLLYAISGKSSAVLAENVSRAAPVTMDAIGLRLLSTRKDGFIVPFEIISILLLVALIGAVVIARRDSGQEEKT